MCDTRVAVCARRRLPNNGLVCVAGLEDWQGCVHVLSAGSSNDYCVAQLSRVCTQVITVDTPLNRVTALNALFDMAIVFGVQRVVHAYCMDDDGDRWGGP